MRYPDALARLRVAVATGILPADLGAWALAELEEARSRGECLAVRDARLREASAMMSGSLWARAERLALEVEALRHGARADDNDVRALVQEALEASPVPRSVRHIYRILARD